MKGKCYGLEFGFHFGGTQLCPAFKIENRPFPLIARLTGIGLQSNQQGRLLHWRDCIGAKLGEQWYCVCLTNVETIPGRKAQKIPIRNP